MSLHAAMPDRWLLEEWEIWEVNRVRMAKYFGVLPSAVDNMPYQDYVNAIAVMNADRLEAELKRGKNG